MVIAAILFLIAGIGQAFPFSVRGLHAVARRRWFRDWSRRRYFSDVHLRVAPAHLRGRLSSLFQLAIVVGIFATQLVNQIIIAMVPDTVQSR